MAIWSVVPATALVPIPAAVQHARPLVRAPILSPANCGVAVVCRSWLAVTVSVDPENASDIPLLPASVVLWSWREPLHDIMVVAASPGFTIRFLTVMRPLPLSSVVLVRVNATCHEDTPDRPRPGACTPHHRHV